MLSFVPMRSSIRTPDSGIKKIRKKVAKQIEYEGDGGNDTSRSVVFKRLSPNKSPIQSLQRNKSYSPMLSPLKRKRPIVSKLSGKNNHNKNNNRDIMKVKDCEYEGDGGSDSSRSINLKRLSPNKNKSNKNIEV